MRFKKGDIVRCRSGKMRIEGKIIKTGKIGCYSSMYPLIKILKVDNPIYSWMGVGSNYRATKEHCTLISREEPKHAYTWTKNKQGKTITIRIRKKEI